MSSFCLNAKGRGPGSAEGAQSGFACGLSPAQVEQSRLEHGENVLTPPARPSLWQLYWEKFRDPIIRILLVAAAVSLGLAFVEGEYIETIGIIIAVLFATTVGFFFERDAARKFDVLNSLADEQPVKVVRGGRVTLVPMRQVVVGDVVVIETGDEIPADGTLLSATDLMVDESSLTGEPSAYKCVLAEGEQDSGHHAYACNVLLRSSMVTGGTARMVVTAVGDATEIGRVAREAVEPTHVKTPLYMQLDRLAGLISKVGTAVSVLAFATFLIHDILVKPLWHTADYIGMAEVVLRYFMMAVTLIVMAVPEGLPMAVTLALALNMRRMLKTGNLVRRLQASETMGAVTVICTDKTGTLTQNRMTVVDYYGHREHMAEAVALNSTAELDGDQGIGNATEVALLRWIDGSYTALRNAAKTVNREPFSTETKQMTTVAETGGATHTYIKGAPEVVLSHCEWADEKERERVRELLATWQRQAMRTLAFVEDGRFQAIVAISDPVRDDVAEAIVTCEKAGIEVKIVTGDTRLTAIEIARQIGILPEKADEKAVANLCMTGEEFAALSDEEAMKWAKTLKVLCRARPHDKQRLVALLQAAGEVVAVTGDGTNDAPALHRAHVGLALGSGTHVAKEAGDITILDDAFASVARAVMWGRSLYLNIQRFLFFQLVVNVTALLLVLGGSIIGTEMPLTVTQILWVNLIMDTFAAMALASLPPTGEVMNDPPRPATASIITRRMATAIALWGGTFFVFTFVYLYWLEHNVTGNGVTTYELTQFFTVFVLLQWWNLFNAKALFSRHSALKNLTSSKGFLLVMAMIALGQWIIVSVGGTMFRTVPLHPIDWLQIIVGTSAVLIIGEFYRWIRRK